MKRTSAWKDAFGSMAAVAAAMLLLACGLWGCKGGGDGSPFPAGNADDDSYAWLEEGVTGDGGAASNGGPGSEPWDWPADAAADYRGVDVSSGWFAEAVGGESWGWADAGDASIPWDPNEGNNGCIANCENQQCGPDGCGGSCGWCSGLASCQAGVCVEVAGCAPQCGGKMIGEDDGCGGVCSGGGFGIGLKPGGAQDVGYFRALVADGQVPTADLFPIEGFLNEHDTPLPPPDFSKFVTLHAFLGLFYDPQADEPLIAMQLGLNSGIDPSVIQSKHFNLVVVVDRSGSMAEEGKLEFVKQGLVMMLDSLDDNDILTLVSYSTVANVEVAPVAVTDETRPLILAQIEELQPSGSTNLFAGLTLGYEMAMQNITDPLALHRVMLLSDGLITEGESNPDIILGKSAIFNEEGIGITTIGVGLSFDFELMYLLANQGNGNFYFLDSGEKLEDVFTNEIEYLLTPVAQDLKISFRLPDGFFVDQIYGFDYQVNADGEVVLLGPSPQYSVGPTGPGDPDQPPPDPDDKQVSVSTLFASKKNGLLMARIRSEQPDVFASWAAMDFAQISYSYDLVNEGSTEYGEANVEMGTLTYFAEDGPESPMAYFTGPIMQRNFCVLRTALAIRQACTLFHQEPPDLGGAVVQIADAETFCNGINLQLNDPALVEDVAFMNQVKANMCTIMQCQEPVQ